MNLFDLFEGNEQAYNWHSDPEQRSMDATRSARLNREREPEGSEAIDARLRAQNDQLAQYAQSGNFWLKQKNTQEHINDQSYTGKAAANAAAVELLKQRPELRGNLVITAYGPGEQQGVAEGSIGDKIKGAAKSVKRATQGWGIGAAPDMITPKGVVQAFGDMDGQRLANFVTSRKDFSKPGKDSARAFADKVIDREMKQRGYGRVADKHEQGVAEAPGAETLGHNQSTVSSNLDSLDLDEGDISQLEKDIAAAPVAPIANMEGDEKIGGRYDADDFDAMVMRLKKLAGSGPMRTVYDPNKRVYKNVPTAQQPAQQPKK